MNPLCPGIPFGRQTLHDIGMPRRKVVALDAIGRQVVQAPQSSGYIDTSFQLPARTARLPSCSQKRGRVRPSDCPTNAGRRLTPSIGWIACPLNSRRILRARDVDDRRHHVDDVCGLALEGIAAIPAEMPRGQCTTSGAAMPPSWVKCLNRRKGVLPTAAQFMPRYRLEFGPPGRRTLEEPGRT